MLARFFARLRPFNRSATARPRGQGLLEFALILPLLLLFILGVIEAGRMLAIYSSLSSAARQAARYGSVAGDSPTLDPLDNEPLAYYEDCAGIKSTALRTSILVGLDTDDIGIGYDRGTTTEPIGRCVLGAATPTLSETIKDGYRVIITITAIYKPLVPIVPLPDMPITFAAARTIFTTIVGPTNTPPPNPDLRITKRGSPPVVSPNGDLTYWITATNYITSGVIAQNIIVTDTLPVLDPDDALTQNDLDDIADDYNWDCTFVVETPPPQQLSCTRLAPLATGQSAGFSYVVRAPLFGGVTLTNTVGVSSSKADVQPSDNVTYTVHQVLPGADLEPHKTVSPTTPIGAGTLLTYTLWVHNNGGDVSRVRSTGPTASQTFIWITDTLPAGAQFKLFSVDNNDWFCTPLPSPSRLSCRYSQDLVRDMPTSFVTVVMTAPTTAGTLVNTAVVTPSALTQDPLLNNNVVTVTSEVVTEADLAMTKLGNATAKGGGNLLYTLRVNNLGPAIATNVRITDVVPGTIMTVTAGAGWTCDSPVVANTVKCVRASSLGVNATTSDITVAIVVPESDISNTAVTGSDMPDPNTANNSATVATIVQVCNVGRVADANSTVTAAPTELQANGTAASQVVVSLKDLCGDPVAGHTVTLNPSPAGLSIISPASGISGSNGQVTFSVSMLEINAGTYTYGATAVSALETVNLSATASVTFYGCVSVTGQNNQVSTQTYVDFRLTNTTGRAWKLTNVSMDWPQPGGRKINQVVMGTTPATILWSGSSNNDPFSLPGSAAWNSGTDTARTINTGVVNQSLLFYFDFVTPGQAFSLAATWDDGNGHTCATSTAVTP